MHVKYLAMPWISLIDSPNPDGGAAEQGVQQEGAAPTPPAAPPTDDEQLGEAGKKALDAERRRAKAAEREAAALRTKLEEHENAQLTELERAKKEAATFREQAEAAHLTLLRREVAAAKNLPPAMGDRLQGTTREALEADAELLLSVLPTASSADQKLRDVGAGRGSETPPASVASGRELYRQRHATPA